MYPEGYQTFVEVEKLSQGLCGDFRPGHFRGVATVVAKLFNIVHPDVAVFGEKDYQQLKVIEQMTKDLNFRIKIIGAKTIREKDGLAMSSRNSYLSKEEREQARALSQALFLAREQVKAGERHADKLIQTARRMLEKIPKLRIEYIEIRDSEKLEPVKIIDKPCQMLMAVWIGKTRLIDNLRICPQNKRKG
jgi:pantoate--beta-alanine ligase